MLDGCYTLGGTETRKTKVGNQISLYIKKIIINLTKQRVAVKWIWIFL